MSGTTSQHVSGAHHGAKDSRDVVIDVDFNGTSTLLSGGDDVERILVCVGKISLTCSLKSSARARSAAVSMSIGDGDREGACCWCCCDVDGIYNRRSEQIERKYYTNITILLSIHIVVVYIGRFHP